MTSEEQLAEIFSDLKVMMEKYQPPFEPKFDEDGKFDLWSFKDIEIAGRKRKQVNFASIITRGKYVGLYYMPIYTDTELANVFKPELLKLLKGKSCFHIKELTPEIKEQVEEALEIGFKLYKDRGWV